jgi:hypothetical protein
MNLVGRRVLTLDDPPGATVTVGPWEYRDFLAFGELSPTDDIGKMWDLFAAHIEAHPWDIDDVRDLDGVAIVAIVNAWTAAMTAPPPLRGRRH